MASIYLGLNVLICAVACILNILEFSPCHRTVSRYRVSPHGCATSSDTHGRAPDRVPGVGVPGCHTAIASQECMEKTPCIIGQYYLLHKNVTKISFTMKEVDMIIYTCTWQNQKNKQMYARTHVYMVIKIFRVQSISIAHNADKFRQRRLLQYNMLSNVSIQTKKMGGAKVNELDVKLE